MNYPKLLMSRNELINFGISRTELEIAYLAPGQTFAKKVNPLKKNSPIKYDTEGFEKWRQKEIVHQQRAIRKS